MAKKTLRQWRRIKELTQEQLAHKAGVTPRSIAYWEDSTENFRRASYNNVRSVAIALKIEVADFDFDSTSKILE